MNAKTPDELNQLLSAAFPPMPIDRATLDEATGRWDYYDNASELSSLEGLTWPEVEPAHCFGRWSRRRIACTDLATLTFHFFAGLVEDTHLKTDGCPNGSGPAESDRNGTEGELYFAEF